MSWVSGEKLTTEKLLTGRWLSRQEYWLKETGVLACGVVGLLIPMTLPQLKPEGGAQLLTWQASRLCPWSYKSIQDALVCFSSSALAKASAILNWKGPRTRPKASVVALLGSRLSWQFLRPLPFVGAQHLKGTVHLHDLLTPGLLFSQFLNFVSIFPTPVPPAPQNNAIHWQLGEAFIIALDCFTNAQFYGRWLMRNSPSSMIKLKRGWGGA